MEIIGPDSLKFDQHNAEIKKTFDLNIAGIGLVWNFKKRKLMGLNHTISLFPIMLPSH